MISSQKIGVVTVTFNSGAVLEDFLVSLDGQSHKNFTLYAIDNASTDNSVRRLSAEHPFDVRVIANPDNVGIAVGNNQGIELALSDRCDWILLLNNDTILPSNLFEDMMTSAVENNAEILTPLIEAAEPTGTIWYSGGRIGSAVRGYQPTHELLGSPISDAPQTVRTTIYASTCCLLIAPSVFASIGLMDPVYFVYYDDLDFAIRANNAGHRYVLDPTIMMLHKASSLTGGPESAFTIRWMSRNSIVLVRRHSRGLTRVAGITFTLAWATARAALRRDSIRIYRARLGAYREGLTLRMPPAPVNRSDKP